MKIKLSDVTGGVLLELSFWSFILLTLVFVAYLMFSFIP
jgi:hypothetical protein